MKMRTEVLAIARSRGLCAEWCLLGLLTLGAMNATANGQSSDSSRVRDGLVVLYDFRAVDGAVVPDRAFSGPPLPLKIDKPAAVRSTPGGLEIHGDVQIRSQQPAERLIGAIRASGALTLEAWLHPASQDQSGPARIMTISGSPSFRNATLGQDGDRYDVRLRTNRTSANGIPSVSTPAGMVKNRLSHLAYTRDRNGSARIYVDGKQVVETRVAGDTKSWDASFQLLIANELGGGRPWKGVIALAAVYRRALKAIEVEKNFRAGPFITTSARVVIKPTHFESRIAPILARHCLECHDAATREGGLDLSRKIAAFQGGESGKAIIAGKASASPLWERIESDEMPEDRPSLTDAEKRLVKDWIDGGAEWNVDFLDPAIYDQDRGKGQQFVRRHTAPEYVRTVRSALGVDIDEEARKWLPRDLRADGFSNTAYNLNVDLGHVEAYARLAEVIVQRINMKSWIKQFSEREDISEAHLREVISKLSNRVLRGPPEPREADVFYGLAKTVLDSGGDFHESMSYVVEAMLQSPRFLYRIENQRGDGTRWPVTAHELASRISYIVWGTGPDAPLLRAATEGRLDPAEVRRQTERMLQDPKALERSKEFLSQWLNLDRLNNLRPSPEHFPDWDPELAGDMRAETLDFFEEVAWRRRRPLSDLLKAQVTFVTPRLARHYNMPAPKGVNDRPVAMELREVKGRGGLLTHGSVLTVGGDEASMVTRGLFVLQDLLRGVVKDPPPCVDTTPVSTKPGLTQRGVAAARIANKACGGCHAKFEPLAFGLERFDGLGTYREKDAHANLLREDGEVLVPGNDKPVGYQSTEALMELLAESDRVKETITWKLTQFAVGRPLNMRDAPFVRAIHSDAAKNGGTYMAVVQAIVASELVLTTPTEPTP